MLMKSDTIESQTLELKELVERASVAIAHYWPMTSFVHHNPIRGLETLQFDDAVRVAERLIGGRGYLQNEQYRQLLKAGRIKDEHLDAAIRSVAREASVELAGRTVSHFEVLRAHMLVGITPPAAETVASLVDRVSISGKFPAAANGVSLQISAAQIRELAKRLAPRVESSDQSSKIGRAMTLLSWCDQFLNKQLRSSSGAKHF